MKKNFKSAMEPATDKDAPEIASLLSWAFGFSKARSEEYIANVGLGSLWLLRGEGRRADACAALLETTQLFHGKSVQAVNIAHVAIAPESRGQGLAVPFVDALCEEAQHEGRCLATLFASTRPVYRKAGSSSPVTRSSMKRRRSACRSPQVVLPLNVSIWMTLALLPPMRPRRSGKPGSLAAAMRTGTSYGERRLMRWRLISPKIAPPI